MNDRPLVSVRLMVYNNEPFIRETIESILFQETDFKVEIVVGDDYSTDKTLDIIKSCRNTENIEIRILDRPIGGEYWNKRKHKNASVRTNFVDIVNNCHGDYIALLDGDDYWCDPRKLQKQVDFMEANTTYAGCFHNTYVINEMKSGNQPKLWRDYTKDTYTLKDTLSTASLFHTSSFLYRRNLSLFPTWFSKVQSGDMALFTIIASQGPLYRIDAPMSVYRKNAAGITNAIQKEEYHTNRIKLFSYFEEYLEGREQEKINEVIHFHQQKLKKLQPTSLKNRIKKFLKP